MAENNFSDEILPRPGITTRRQKQITNGQRSFPNDKIVSEKELLEVREQI
ncbi:MAG: hypothetical protein MZU84_07815 [Sphingobacterium sp.]|nr:hypothetical protein [Sphingobacterium sp.]